MLMLNIILHHLMLLQRIIQFLHKEPTIRHFHQALRSIYKCSRLLKTRAKILWEHHMEPVQQGVQQELGHLIQALLYNVYQKFLQI